ncbi:MAG TPA: class I SAM-dependent methyltransferase [Flavisolibacter sp.]|jgi:2-polyprenyl-3-methyl-5-hydroxy-6-metoxy-1,4-benzoquinol methylase|nr:class I SAM-dependent methyltransferase [Flavisolibacter sp.]
MNNTVEYYSLPRREVFQLIKGQPSNILECGCGFGELGKHIKNSWPCTLSGVELNPKAGEFLNDVYDKYFIADVETFDASVVNETFDCIIYADVLEHLRDPERVIKEHIKFLRKEGQVIISIPNIRNLKVIADLLVKGEWNYGDSGILDRTHYKFFTLKSLKELLRKCGLEIETISSNKDEFKGLKKTASLLPYFFIPELKVCQWLIRARKV